MGSEYTWRGLWNVDAYIGYLFDRCSYVGSLLLINIPLQHKK